MSKKRKYQPGWQARRRQEDLQIQQQAKERLDEYYAKQDILNKIEQAAAEAKRSYERPEEDVQQNNTQENDSNILEEKNTQLPSPQVAVPNQKKDTSSYGRSYTTESAQDYLKRTSDPNAFKDQFAPSILDQDAYQAWAVRQSLRGAANPTIQNDPVTKQANAAVNMYRSFAMDDLKKKESVPERYNRRIWEHNAFSTVNKDKGLTNNEINEIIAYRTLTDPQYGYERINEIHENLAKQEQQELAELNAVQQPDNYYGDWSQNTPKPLGYGIAGPTGDEYAAMDVGKQIADWIGSKHSKSFMSDFMLKTNESQMKVSTGQIQRSKEFVDLSNSTIRNVNDIERYANNLVQLERYNQIAKSVGGFQNLDPQRREIYYQILDENKEIQQRLQTNAWWKNANNLASWAPTTAGYVAGIVDKIVDDDIGGVRNGLYGLDGKLDDLQKLLGERVRDDNWLERVTKATSNIKKQLTNFNAKNAEKQEVWKEQALTDAQDIVDWKTGNNILGLKANIDPYYSAQERLLEKSNFDWSDPVKMAQFGWSGVAGGSNSSWWKSIISIGSKAFGIIGGAATTGGTSALIQVGSIGASFEADKSAGSDENNIESSDRVSQRLSSLLHTAGSYEEFLKEGEQALLSKPVNVSAKFLFRDYEGTTPRNLLNQLSDDKKREFIMDAFLSGMWQSKNPKITKMHADAVIGANNQFYNDQPVNTADAAIGSIVDIANLSTVKYLARATKIMHQSNKLRFNRYMMNNHPDAVIRFAGFKNGMHNLGVKVAENKITRAVENGLIKFADKTSKIPLGVVAGSTAGALGGYYESDGSVLGAAAGALVGGASLYGAHKGLKWIGVEDKIARQYQKARAFATRIPGAWLKAAAIGKGVGNITGRVGLDTASEMGQEGVQALNARDDFDYDVQHNRALLQRVFDDMLLGSRAAYIWLNQNDPEMLGEADVYSQMNATPLLTLIGPNSLQVGVQMHNTVSDYKLASVVAANIDAERRGNIAELEQNRSYAKYLSKDQKEEMHKKFEAYRKIAGIHDDATQKADPEVMLGEDKHHIPVELIDQQEQDYEDIYELGNSLQMRAIGARAHAKPGSDKYAQLVAYESFARKRKARKYEALQKKDEEQAALLGESALADIIDESTMRELAYSDELLSEKKSAKEIGETQQKKYQTPADVAKLLVQALTLFRIVDDYTQLQKLSGREDIFLNRSKSRLNQIKETLSKFGIDIETEEDVRSSLNMSDEGIFLRQLMERAARKEAQQNGIEYNESALLTSDLLDSYADMLRERELLEFDFVFADQQYKQFHENPLWVLDKWDARTRSDEKLEAILEADYIEHIQEYEKAQARTIQNGDLYQGYDGEYYIVRFENGKYRKHRWHKDGSVDRTSLPFDRVEYDTAKTREEESVEEQRKRRRANSNINNGGIQPQEEASEEQVEEQPVVESAQEPEPTILYKPGEYVQVVDESGDATSAIVVEQETNGDLTVEYPSGKTETIQASGSSKYIVGKINSPISLRKYPSGEIITKSGKKYAIAKSVLESIDEENSRGVYSYEVIDIETGEVSKMTEEEIDELLNKEPEEESTKFEENEKQLSIRAKLEEKLEKDKKLVGNRKPSPHDYFLKIGNRITRFLRVHGILDPVFDRTQDEIDEENRIKSILAPLYEKSDKSDFKKEVKTLQDEYNKKLEDAFGADSYEYKYYKIDLSPYTSTSVLIQDGVVDAISSILSSFVTHPMLIVGTHIDSIARDFFKNKGVVENKPEYNMSQSTFNSVISQLKKLRDRFNELKWVVYTDDFVWHGQTGMGTHFAGATDMIAVDQQGRIHVLDFKTTGNANRFETYLQYEGVIPSIGDDDVVEEKGWLTVDSEDQIPDGANRRVSSDFLTQLATKDHGAVEGKRTYAAQYARQLAAYRNLIQQEIPGAKVTSLEIIPFYVGYETEDDKVTSIYEVHVYDPVDLTSVKELESDLDEIDSFLSKSNVSDRKDEVNEEISMYDQALADVSSYGADPDVLEETRDGLASALSDYYDTIKSLKEVLKDDQKLADSVYVNQLLENARSRRADISRLAEKADQEIEDANRDQDEDEGNPPTPPTKTGIEWVYEKLEEVVDSAREFWWQFNNLHSWSDAVKKIPHYMESIIKNDFIKNATFIISNADNSSKPVDGISTVLKVTIKYRGFTFKDINLRLGNEAVGEARNRQSQGLNFDLYSIMGRNLIRQFFQLKQMFPGKTIIATKVERTNGSLVYVDEDVNLEDTIFLSKNDPRYGKMLDGDDSIIGVVDEDGNIVEITDGKRHPLWSPEYTDAGLKHPKKRLDVKPGSDFDTIPPGTVMFLYKFKFDEDPENAEPRIVPITVKGFKLSSEKGPSDTAKALIAILKNVAAGGKLSTLPKVTAVLKDGSTKKIQIPGLTRQKVIKLFTRFGQAAGYAGHEFVFDYARDGENNLLNGHLAVTITAMDEEPRVGEDGMLHRDPVTLRLDKEEDVQRLYNILQHVEFHINQFGNMRHQLNKTTDDSPFGNLQSVFFGEGNEDIQSIRITDEVVIDREDVEKGLTGIEWAIRHGIAKVNAVGIENPLISIHELGVEGQELPKDDKPVQVGTSSAEESAAAPVEQEIASQPEPDEDEETPVVRKKGSKKRKHTISDEELMNLISDEDDNTDYGQMHVDRSKLRKKHLSDEEKDKIVKRMRRLVGFVPVKWTPHVIDILKSGAAVVGQTAADAFELYDKMPEGTEYHEAFHRIMEILLPNFIREHLYDEYYNKHNAAFKEQTGRDLTDKDISEAFAEMFRYFMTDREHVQFKDLSKTFGQLKQMIDGLRSLGSKKIALLFLIANSGVFRFVKPNTKNVAHFVSQLGGIANLTISTSIKGEKQSADLKEFPSIGGKDFFDDAVSCIIYALCTSYNIQYLAQNASKLKTDLKSIQTLYKKGEKTEHSSWFRVLTGEYANEGDEMNVDDAKMYLTLFGNTPEVKDVVREYMEQLGEDMTDEEWDAFKKDSKRKKITKIQAILDYEGSFTKDELDQKQKMMAELFSDKVWPIVEQKVNRRLAKMGVDSELQTYEQQADAIGNQDGTRDLEQPGEGTLGTDIADHSDYFFDHSRTDDATAAIRFFLSSIPDEHFATQEDVEAGIVPSTTTKKTKKDGTVVETPVLVKNRSTLLGFKTFLSMKTVSQRLLSECNGVKNAEELDEILQQLAEDDPIFYRIAIKYHNAKQNEILKSESGKNIIFYNGNPVADKSYAQHRDENGYYYTWVEDGEDTGNRIEGAVTQVDPDMESFVTQLFNFVACQRLDFIRVKISQRMDDEGELLDNQYNTEVQKTSDDYAARVYPRSWFLKLVSGFSGVFKMTPSGEYEYTKDGESLLNDAVDTIHKVYRIIRSTKNTKDLTLHGRSYDKANQDDVRRLISEYVSALNTLGIDISRDAFEYYLKQKYGRSRRLSGCLLDFFGEANPNGLSYKTFLDKIDYIQKHAIEKGGKLLSQSRKEIKEIKRGKFRKEGQQASGANLYTDNSVVCWLGEAESAYNKSTKELMTNGPEGTKRYLMAQSHTVSDITLDINDAECDTSQPANKREFKKSRIVRDMANYIYNFVKTGKHAAIPIGSLIIKHVFNNGKINLVLHTHGGIMMDGDRTGGKSYSDITEREDWLAKYAILKDGGIIFPTLSDKSTWFYLTGVRVPGLNYKNLQNTPSNQLLTLGIIPGQDAASKDLHVMFDYNVSNEQIDQMLEYAECEMLAIEREINRKTPFPFIEFFNENKKRFSGLVEIVKMDEKGEKKLVLLNDYDETPEKCLQRAKEEFFDLPIQERRKIMMLTLEEGFNENVRMLERAGLIVANNRLKEDVLDASGNPTGEKVLQNRLLQYSNVGLDDDVIQTLRDRYIEKLDIKKTDEAGKKRCESLAIMQTIWDIYMRGVISEEEVERMYIGQPQFFEWHHGKIFDSLSKKVINCLTDRHKDQSKRLGGAGSTGEKNRLDLADVRRKYVCAEIEDKPKEAQVQSALYKDFEKTTYQAALRQAYLDYKTDQIEQDENLTDEQKQEALNNLNDELYDMQNDKDIDAVTKKIEDELEKNAGIALDHARASAKNALDALDFTKPADGAAFISPKMAKTLLRMRGKFTSNVQEAFMYLEGKTKDGKNINPLRASDAYKVIIDALLGTQKYSAYGYRINAQTEDIPIHYYDKFALFPLFKYMATGFTADLLRKMEEDGIDMLMMHSGVKTGSEEASMCYPGMFDSEESFKNFHFHTYEQDYAFIRRQLNTEPREKDTTTMGTQMTKVALANLKPNKKYKRFIGRNPVTGKDEYEVVRGYEVLNDIMDAIKALSDLGEAEIRKEVFNADGTLNIDNFSAFLERELDSRDADANLIDGIQVVEEEEEYTDPETGEIKTRIVKHFNVELEAMSSIDWIQSILVSKINKETCDINVKGNALYQRPDWGVEGKPLILDDQTVDFAKRGINGGKRLQVINNDGSMDAVISIDFFYDILPKGIRDDFEKAREWLLKHKIIGNTDDVHACCINARIPTQAQSSIGALRFVDVLPIVRDTIILPAEITGIDGSDFDIDKRYLVRLSYNIKYGKKGEEDVVSTDFKEGSVDYWRNKLIYNYITVLKSYGIATETGVKFDANSHVALYSIDKDTKLVTDVRDIINAAKPKKRYYAYMFGNIAFQVATKIKFMIGKFGIGPFALNNNNHILTMLYKVRFASWKNENYTNILEQLGCLSLSKSLDKQGKRIMSWLSGLINVHVDIAKNPDSIEGLNINAFTYNLVNLLIRTGMGERALFFTGQPIMEELSRVYNDASGTFMADPNVSKSKAQRDAIDMFLIDSFASQGRAETKRGMEEKLKKYMLSPYAVTDQERLQYEDIIGTFAKALFGIDDKGNYTNTFMYYSSADEAEIKEGNILQDILTNPEVLKNKNAGVSFNNLEDQRRMYRVRVKNEDGQFVDVDLTPKQVQEYVAYIQNCLNIYGEQLSNLVNATKIDTKKHGKNYIEQRAYLDKYKDVFEGNEFFEQEGLTALKEHSYVDVKTTNATKLYKDILQNISMQANNSFDNLCDKILSKLNSSIQNTTLANKVSKAIMTHVKTEFFKQYLKQQGETYYDDLLYGEDNIMVRLIKFQNKVKNVKNKKYSRYGTGGTITNPLLKALRADVYEKRQNFDDPVFITLENALLEDSDNSSALERAWDEMYHDKDEEIRRFALDLAIYAFLNSGDKVGGGTFFKFVPNSIRKDISIQTTDGEKLTYNQWIRRQRELFQAGLSDETIDKLADDIIYENWSDNDFVKLVPLKKTYKDGGSSRNLTTRSRYIDVSTQRVRHKKNGKVWFQSESTRKSIITEVAGAVKKKSGTIVTINKNGEEYPPYIKIRRNGSDRYDNDNILLYKYIGENYIDEKNPDKGSYPVYRIFHPESGRFRAGFYFYDIYCANVSDKQPMYPHSVTDALDILYHEQAVSDAESVDDVLKQIAEAFNEMSVWMGDENLDDFISHELFLRDVDVSEKDLKKYRENLKKLLETVREKSELNKEKSKKQTEIEYESDGSVDIWWGTKDTRKNGYLSNLAPRKVKYDGEVWPSVEAAFQAQKLKYSDTTVEYQEDVKEQLKLSQGSDATAIGGKIEDLNKSEWDKVKGDLLYEIMKASFEQNEDAKDLLLSTGDAKLTHKKASKRYGWDKEFPKLLTQIRAELKSSEKPKKEKQEQRSEQKSKSKESGSSSVIKLENYPQFKSTAQRQFTYNGVQFSSAHQAYNYFVVDALDIDAESKNEYKQDILSTTDTAKIKSIVSEAQDIATDPKPMTKEEMVDLRLNIIKESFRQNPDLLKQLLGTEGTEFENTSAGKALTAVRSDLSQEEREDGEFDDSDQDEEAAKTCKQ